MEPHYPSGNYYLTANQDGKIERYSSSFFPETIQEKYVKKDSNFFFRISDGEIVTFENIIFNDINSAPQFTPSLKNGAFMGGVNIPTGWYKINKTNTKSETSELSYEDFIQYGEYSFFPNEYDDQYFYVNETTSINLDELAIEPSLPMIRNTEFYSWIQDNFEESLATMQKICTDETTKNLNKDVMSVYFSSENDYSVYYASDSEKKPRKNFEKDLLKTLNAIEQKNKLTSVTFYEGSTEFYFELPSEFKVTFTYKPYEKNTVNMPGLPLPNHPEWYYRLTQE